jgi:dTDP-4-amino-4,6-dideoxygalactose transaminase
MEDVIPFLDLKSIHKALKPQLMEAISGIIDESGFIGGPWLDKFEAQFAELASSHRAVGVSSGTSALRLGLRAAGIKPGDTVITVPNTFIATTAAISQVGAKFVFVDIEPDTCLMDAKLLDRALDQSGAKAILPVHLYGQCADMDAINTVAAHHGAVVFEDAAQAHGATYKGRVAGSLGIAAAFSFYPGKNLGAGGEGGAVTTNDETLAETVGMLRDHGQKVKLVHELEGDNARLDAMQAAFLSIKLEHLENWNQERRVIAGHYDSAFKNHQKVNPVAVASHNVSSCHLYVIHVEQRDVLRGNLANRGIMTGLHYPLPLHLQPCYQNLGGKAGAFPNAERSADTLLSLPIFPGMTMNQISRVIDTVLELV